MVLKRKRFHPDETYDSMVVSYSSDDAVSVDPVHGNGKFVCNLNNVNSVTHARKLLPLRAKVPNSYDNVTEGRNTLQYSLELSREFELKSPDNEFEFDYRIEFTVATGPYLVGDKKDIPAFGNLQANEGTSPYNFNVGTKYKAVVPEGTYTLQTFSAALDQAIYDVCKADHDYRFPVVAQSVVWDMNEWLTHGPNFVTGAPTSGWESMTPAYGTNGNETKRTYEMEVKTGTSLVSASLSNAWALSNVTATGVTPTGTWPDHPPVAQPVLDVTSPAAFVPGNNYKRIALILTLTANQQDIFGYNIPITHGDPPDLTALSQSATLSANAVDTKDIALGYEEGGPTSTVLSQPFTITPGYYNKAQLADAIDTAMKAAVHVYPFQWLHRIRSYYDDLPTFDSDVDLRRCEYDATADVFKFYFSPDLLGVVAPTQNLTTTYTYNGSYGDVGSSAIDSVSLVGDSSLLRMMGFKADNVLALPVNASLTILQSVNGGCPNMDIPCVHITSPQIARNNVLTSDSQNRHILVTIPMTGVARCDYGHYTGVDIYVDNIDYKGPTSLDKVEFIVTDDKHNQLTIPEHTPVSVDLKVYHDDTDP